MLTRDIAFLSRFEPMSRSAHRHSRLAAELFVLAWRWRGRMLSRPRTNEYNVTRPSQSMSTLPEPRGARPRPGKRKRATTLSDGNTAAECDSATSSDAPSIKIEDGPDDIAQISKARRAPKPKKDGPSKSKRSVRPVECKVPWPDRFKALDKTHRALNLVFTFCCTRKHLATTLDTIRSAVEAHTKQPLEIPDVAAVAALRPEGINFGYVDEVMLQLDARGAERDDTFKTGRAPRALRAQAPAADASVGGITGREELGAPPPSEELSGREVLYFEFVDGDLKRQVQDRKTGQAVRPTRKLREEDLKLPVYSQKQMTELIEKRNLKFTNAVNLFLNRCLEEGVDPVAALATEAEKLVPVPSTNETAATAAAAAGPKPAASSLPATLPEQRK